MEARKHEDEVISGMLAKRQRMLDAVELVRHTATDAQAPLLNGLPTRMSSFSNCRWEKVASESPGVRSPPLSGRLAQKQKMLNAVESLREQNPMLGLRGVRLGIHLPKLIQMQVRAIFEAACKCARKAWMWPQRS